MLVCSGCGHFPSVRLVCWCCENRETEPRPTETGPCQGWKVSKAGLYWCLLQERLLLLLVRVGAKTGLLQPSRPSDETSSSSILECAKAASFARLLQNKSTSQAPSFTKKRPHQQNHMTSSKTERRPSNIGAPLYAQLGLVGLEIKKPLLDGLADAAMAFIFLQEKKVRRNRPNRRKNMIVAFLGIFENFYDSLTKYKRLPNYPVWQNQKQSPICTYFSLLRNGAYAIKHILVQNLKV